MANIKKLHLFIIYMKFKASMNLLFLKTEMFYFTFFDSIFYNFLQVLKSKAYRIQNYYYYLLQTTFLAKEKNLKKLLLD